MWTTVATPNLDASRLYNRVGGLDVLGTGNIWAIGDAYMDQEGGRQVHTLLHWNGAAWRLRPGPTESGISGLVSSEAAPGNAATLAYFTDHGLIVHDKSWRLRPAADPGTHFWHLNAATALSPNNIWGVGVTAGSGATGALIEHWDGSAWRIISSPGAYAQSLLYAISARSASDMWAVGEQSHAGQTDTLIEHWDGSRWSVVPSPNANVSGRPAFDHLFSVDALSADSAWAVGSYGATEGTGGGGEHTLIEHWDGKAWSIVSSPEFSSSSRLDGIAVDPKAGVWAVGSINVQHSSQALIEHWDGKRWTRTPVNPGPGATLSDVGVAPSGTIWTVGSTYSRSGQRNLAMRCAA